MTHQELAHLADDAFAQARQRSGSWIACRDGCDCCCRRPFAITQSDATALKTGLSRLPEQVRETIRSRARDAWQRLSIDFPGDTDTGTLTGRDDWRTWFFERNSGVPCPVLNLETGGCLLYEARPVACRLYGPLIQIGDQTSDPCPLCFQGASPGEVAATKVTVELPLAPESEGDTIIAFALSLPR